MNEATPTQERAGATPGPWETRSDAVPEWHSQHTIYAEETGERVATAFLSEANAQLIAQAPALRDALEALTVSAKALAEGLNAPGLSHRLDACVEGAFAARTLLDSLKEA